MSEIQNPYVAGNPVGNSNAFVGRIDILRNVLRILRRPQDNALLLYGQRRIGKTSILENLAYWLPQEGNYRPVLFDLQDKASWSVGKVLQSLAQTLAYALKIESPDLGENPEVFFQEVWLPKILDTLPDSSSLVLLLDEFDVLADEKSDQAVYEFFPYLRQLMDLDRKRLQFIFVIGRNINDLTNIALSIFKNITSQRVSLLSEAETAKLVRLSESNKSLNWSDESIQLVYELTNGHPLLTQQLCSHVWEKAYDEEPGQIPTAVIDDVENVVDDVLDASHSNLEWLWDGLPPAARIVSSALAEAGPQAISHEDLEKLLQDSGVRVVIKDLQNAPKQLKDWDILEPVNGRFRFKVELLRQWLAEYKPLQLVQEELNHIEPVAQSLYQAAEGLYRRQEFEQAVPPLRQAISLNPNHVPANRLLADILLSEGRVDEAEELLEQLYQYQPLAARPRLVQIILQKALHSKDQAQQLAYYERVLTLNPTQPEALTGQRQILERQGDEAIENEDFETAIEFFKQAQAVTKVQETEKKIYLRNITAKQDEISQLEEKKLYLEALALTDSIIKDYPTEDWDSPRERIKQSYLSLQKDEISKLEEKREYESALKMSKSLQEQFPEFAQDPQLTELHFRLNQKTHLHQTYIEAIEAFRAGNYPQTVGLLISVISLEPDYENAAYYLLNSIKHVDAIKLQEELDKVNVLLDDLRQSFNKKIEAERSYAVREKDLKTKNKTLEKELKDAQKTIEDLHERFASLNVATNKKLNAEAQKQKRLLEQLEEEKKRFSNLYQTIHSLPRFRPWNPFHYVRLSKWLFLEPHNFLLYRNTYGDSDIYDIGSWFISSLFCLPLLLLTLAINLGFLPQMGNISFLQPVSIVNYIVIGLSWLTLRLSLRTSSFLWGAISLALLTYSIISLASALSLWEAIISAIIISLFSGILGGFLTDATEKEKDKETYKIKPGFSPVENMSFGFSFAPISIGIASGFITYSRASSVWSGIFLALLSGFLVLIGSGILSAILIFSGEGFHKGKPSHFSTFLLVSGAVVIVVMAYLGGWQWLRP